MPQQFIKHLIEKSSIENLEVIIAIKKEIAFLQQKHDQLNGELESFNKMIESIYDKIPDIDIEINVTSRVQRSPGKKENGW